MVYVIFESACAEYWHNLYVVYVIFESAYAAYWYNLYVVYVIFESVRAEYWFNLYRTYINFDYVNNHILFFININNGSSKYYLINRDYCLQYAKDYYNKYKEEIK